MNRLTRNVLANAIGSIWGVLLSLVTIPIQIRILGAEAYGLIGFIASLQLLLVVFDFGLSSSVVREIAASADEDLIPKIIQTSATIYWIVSLTVAAVIFLSAEWISTGWLQVETLTPEVLTLSIRIIAVYIALTWPVGHYANVLFALNRLDLVNALKIVTNFIGQIGGIVVVLVTRNVTALLAWLAAAALLSVVLHGWLVTRVYVGARLSPGISLLAVRRLWRTSFDMNIVSTTVILYTQLDKLLISSLLPLSLLGYYNIAYRLMVGATLVPTSIGTSTLPNFTEYHVREQTEKLVAAYQRVQKWTVFLMSGFTFALVFWGRDFIALWTTAETAAYSYQTLGVLAIGALFNSVTVPAYYLLLATGCSGVLRTIYAIGALPYCLVLYLLINYAGILGAAIALLLYSVYLIVTMLASTSRRITHQSVMFEFNRTVTPFVLLSAVIFGAGRVLMNSAGLTSPVLVWTVGVTCGLTYCLAGFSRLDAGSRQALVRLLPESVRSLLKR